MCLCVCLPICVVLLQGVPNQGNAVVVFTPHALTSSSTPQPRTHCLSPRPRPLRLPQRRVLGCSHAVPVPALEALLLPHPMALVPADAPCQVLTNPLQVWHHVFVFCRCAYTPRRGPLADMVCAGGDCWRYGVCWDRWRVLQRQCALERSACCCSGSVLLTWVVER